MIPDGWQIQDLTDVALIILGQSPPSSACNETVKGYPFYQGNADFGHLHPLPQRWIENPLKIAKKDDILISVRAPVGELNIANTDCCIGRGVGAIRPLSANRDFVYYTLLNARNSLASVSQGSTFDAINGKELRNLHILIPPLPEQKKIAAILSSVDDAIRATQAVIDQTHRVKQGLMQQLLSRGIRHTRFKQTEIGEIPEEWDVVQLSDVGTLSSGSTPLRREKSYFCNAGGHYWVKTMDLTDGIVLQTDEKITDKALAETSCKLNSPGTIMIAMYGGFKQIGRTGILKTSAATNQAICCIDLNRNRASPEFCNIWLVGNRYRWKTIAASSRKDPNITKKDVSQFPLPLPTIEEQQNIVTIFQSLDDQLFSAESELQLLKLLKRGLMQDLLTGRVRVKLNGTATS